MAKNRYLKFLDLNNIHAGLARVFIDHEIWPTAVDALTEHQDKLKEQINRLEDLKNQIKKEQEIGDGKDE